MAAATPAFSDSVAAAIGIRTVRSQVCCTNRDRPLPSEPITSTSGSVPASRSARSTVPLAARPTTTRPCFWYDSSVLVRFPAWATGIRAAAPAEVFQAPAVIPALRRSGMTMPCAPNAAAERITAPRLRGSVTPSRATNSGVSAASSACRSRSSGWA
jgi:hypothetical protein